MKFLVVGLGNIGNEYAGTRHNIGFDVVNALVQKNKSSLELERLAYTAKFNIKGKTVICICPTTYMNLSGKAVKYWMDKEKIALENILVVLDDLSLPLNSLRLKASGSAGGHNGLKNIELLLGTAQYARLKFGIGNNFPKGMQSDFVLGKWWPEEVPIVKEKITNAINCIESFILNGLTFTLNNYSKN